MTFSVPYSFVPGTKAKAQEVNANFSSVAEQIDETNNLKLNKDCSNISNDGLNVIKNTVSGKNIGEIIYSAVPLDDAGLHILDGSLLRGNGVYSDFVSYIADLSEQVANADYFTTEADWQDTVSEYGFCTKFVYDSANETVRIPKFSVEVEGNEDINAYIVVAASAKADIQIDVNEVMTEVNAKANNELNNLLSTGKILISNLSMPSTRYVDLTPGASGATYTAPSNGYVYVAKNNGSANAKVYVNIDNGSISNVSWYYGSGTANMITSFLPIAKGQTFNVTFTATGAWALFRFVYAKGSESEA